MARYILHCADVTFKLLTCSAVS